MVAPANINGPGQVVIAGDAAAVDRASELCKARGARRAVRLAVSAPFHCALMRPAQSRRPVPDVRSALHARLRVRRAVRVRPTVV